MNRLFVSSFVIALASFPLVAHADGPKAGASDPAAAQSLFYEARTLMQQNRFSEACPKLEESMRLDPGIGTQFNLADCHEHVGKTATAWAGFLDVAAQAKAAGQADREKVARKRAQALEPKLPKLVIEVPSPAPAGLEVKRDGILVGAAAFGTSIPVDPGAHKITATATGKQTWDTQITVADGKTAKVAIPRDLPAAPIVAAAPVTPAGAGSAGEPPVAVTTTTGSATTFTPPIIEEPSNTQRTLGWIAAGLGAAGLGVGAGFGVASISNRDESRQYCVGDRCNAQGVALRDDAIRDGNISTISMIAGGAVLAGGLILVLTAPSSSKERSGKLRAAPSVATNGGGFMFQGSF